MVIIRTERIETEKINLVIENKARLIDNLEFNEITIKFLIMLYEEYSHLLNNRQESPDDLPLYKSLLDIIKNECKYCYKLSRDISHAISNMENGIYRDLDISAIEEDMLYIKFIINKYNN